MLKASFDAGTRTATGEYVYQYDRGQVLEVHGLPALDDKGAIVTIQFAYATDKQTVGTEAIRDKGVLYAKIPDEILLESQEARAYIYIARGAEEARTQYEIIFTPIARPAPSDRVPIEVSNEWDVLKAEIATHIDDVNAAANRANAAAASVSEELRELGADKSAWETRLQGVESKAADAVSKAADAASKAASAESAAANAVSTANAASQAAAGARDRADSAHSLASSANAKATGAHYWAVNAGVTVDGGGWSYNGTYDRYERNFTVSGMTAAMMPVISTASAGAKCPIIGAVSYGGGVTLYAAEVPTVSATVNIKGINVRG